MIRIIYFASSHRIGLTALLTEKACVLSRISGPQFLFLSGEREQLSGLFERLEKNQVHYEIIPGLDRHAHFIRLVMACNERIKVFSPDVIHVQTNWQLAIVAAAKYLFGHTYLIVYTIHGYRHNYRTRSLLARMVMGIGLQLFADRVFVTSSFLKRRFAFLGGKLDLLFLGVDRRYFEAARPPSFEAPMRFIFPAEFRKGKNQELLIRAMRRFIDEGGDASIELLLPGNGERIEECKLLCKELGLDSRVFFPGFLDRETLLKYYSLCQFAVIPTNVETFGLSIAESFVLGKVVISRRVGVAEDILISGCTGYLFDTEEDLVRVLKQVWKDKAKNAEISANAWKMRDVFVWETICERYLTILMRYVGKKLRKEGSQNAVAG